MIMSNNRKISAWNGVSGFEFGKARVLVGVGSNGCIAWLGTAWHGIYAWD